jgi:GntR family transcriptional regulator
MDCSMMLLNGLSATKKINKDLPVPFYYQMVQILREGIRDYETPSQTGEVIFPSESELSEFFRVNRGTVRHALDMLEREGLIYREKGRGTFLRRRRVELDLTQLCSTTDDLKSRGWVPNTRLISLKRTPPRAHVQHHLDLPDGDLVWEIFRLRLANDEPISLQWSYIPENLTPGLDEKDLNTSLYSILTHAYGIELKAADQIVRTRATTFEEAELLATVAGASVFEFSRTTFDQFDRPVEYLDAIWRGDRYDLRVRLYCNPGM